MPHSTRRAFTLIDTAVTVVCVGSLGAITIVGLERARGGAGLEQCTFQLGQIGAANGQFGLSNQDLMVGYTWQQGEPNSEYADLNALATLSPTAAHAAQAIDGLRRRGRPDIPPIVGWLPDIQYTTQVLAEFQGRSLDDVWDVCPNQGILQGWRRRPGSFEVGKFAPLQPAPTPESRRYPYSSSYTTTAGAFDRHQSVLQQIVVGRRVEQGSTHASYIIPTGSSLGPSSMSLVALPSLKAFFFDSHQRHFGGVDLFYCYPASTQPMLFFDGAVVVRMSGSAFRPWRPNQPGLPTPEQFDYQPAPWEPPLASGLWGTEQVTDAFRFTRNGLLGRDF